MAQTQLTQQYSRHLKNMLPWWMNLSSSFQQGMPKQKTTRQHNRYQMSMSVLQLIQEDKRNQQHMKQL